MAVYVIDLGATLYQGVTAPLGQCQPPLLPPHTSHVCQPFNLLPSVASAVADSKSEYSKKNNENKNKINIKKYTRGNVPRPLIHATSQFQFS